MVSKFMTRQTWIMERKDSPLNMFSPTRGKNMATKKKVLAKKAVKRSPAAVVEIPGSTSIIPAQLQEFLKQTSIPKDFVKSKKLVLLDLRKRINQLNLIPTVPVERLL